MAESKQLHIIIPAEAHDALKKIADSDRRGISDVTRDAIEQYLKSRGVDIAVVVERGGVRKGSE